MFRGKEFSNRIKISRLVQELLNFGDLGSLWLWGWGGEWIWVGGGERVSPHMCTCMHTHGHACMVNMIISCKWLPPLGESLGIPFDVICARTCVLMHACTCMYTCVGGTHSPPPPRSTHPPPPRGDPRNQSKFNST